MRDRVVGGRFWGEFAFYMKIRSTKNGEKVNEAPDIFGDKTIVTKDIEKGRGGIVLPCHSVEEILSTNTE